MMKTQKRASTANFAKKGLKRCGEDCYNPMLYTCFDNISCNGEAAINWYFILFEDFLLIENKKNKAIHFRTSNWFLLSWGRICEKGYKLCGQHCYKQNIKTCLWRQTLGKRFEKMRERLLWWKHKNVHRRQTLRKRFERSF